MRPGACWAEGCEAKATTPAQLRVPGIEPLLWLRLCAGCAEALSGDFAGPLFESEAS